MKKIKLFSKEMEGSVISEKQNVADEAKGIIVLEGTKAPKGKNTSKEKKAPKEKKILTKKQKRIRKILWIIGIIAAIILIIIFILSRIAASFMNNAMAGAQATTAKVERRTIENVLSSSSTVSPLDTYSVTTVSSVEGTIISADFEEGDLVQKGDVLYQISTDNMESSLSSAEKSLERSQKKYDDAVTDYNKAKADYQDLNIKATASGYVKSLELEQGDEVTANSQVAHIYNNKTMLLKVPFNASDVNDSLIGQKAAIEISDTDETITGTVTKVNGVNETLSGGRVVRYVTISVTNPGGLTTDMTATASVGDLYCNEAGSFAITDDVTIMAGSSGEISQVCVKEGSWVEKDTVLYRLSSESVEDQLDSLQDQIDSAKDNVEDAETKLEDVKENITDYTITSPITGTVIQKNFKVGDTLNASSMNSTLCLIYDLSAMTFDMSVDELDVHSVKVGQTVNITADAIEGATFEGTITNISLVSTSSNGVTQYPVSVRIDETGDLLPGMNISGEIVIQSAENVLAVPADSLMRGNVVYVEDASVTEAIGDVPAGYRSVDVTVGITDDEYIEITGGLSEGDMVYVPARVANTGFMFGMGGGPQGGMERSQNVQGGPGGNQSNNRSSNSGGNFNGNSGGGNFN